MSKVATAKVSRAHRHPTRVRKTGGRLHNFGMGTRWIVRPDGDSYGSSTSSHDSLARCAGYKNAEQAYADGALRVHYDPATNAIRVEATKATPQAIALAKQIIAKVPAGLAHVAIGEGEDFRSYIGEPRKIAALISRGQCVSSRLQISSFLWAGTYETAAQYGT
jgi:hypothetical protein